MDTETFHLEPACAQDVPELIQLMGSVVPDCAPHTVWNLPWNWQKYQVLRDPREGIIAAGSLQEWDTDKEELRGIVVKPSRRGTGVASQLLNQLLCSAHSRGKTPICITGKPEFFRRFGFQNASYLWSHPWHRDRPNVKASQRMAMVLHQGVVSDD